MTVYASTGRNYADGAPVPFPIYRCVSRVAGGHVCKLTVDHQGEHRCLCNKKWRPTS